MIHLLMYAEGRLIEATHEPGDKLMQRRLYTSPPSIPTDMSEGKTRP
jgi:hypothetical protein